MAELVAAILKRGGLLASDSNPGAATPENLHQMYKDRAAAAANPFVLRDMKSMALVRGIPFGTQKEREALLQRTAIMTPVSTSATSPDERQLARSTSPTRGTFKVVSQRRTSSLPIVSATGLQLSLASLDMRTHVREKRSAY